MADSSRDLGDILGGCLPDDHYRQTNAEDYVNLFYDRLWKGAGRPRVLDLGCGDGRSLDVFRRRDPTVDWVGTDIADLPRAPGQVPRGTSPSTMA
jgi:SAM-dependent methyltransferase